MGRGTHVSIVRVGMRSGKGELVVIFSFSKAACVASVLSVLGCQSEVDIKSQIRAEDRHAVDRPNRQDPDFASMHQASSPV